MLTRHRIVRLITPVATFLGGVLASLVFDRLTNQQLGTFQAVDLAILIGLIMVIVILIIVLATLIIENQDERKTILELVGSIRHQFALSAEYVEDGSGKNEGMTYDRTKRLIDNAQTSLVFVDFWVQTGNYLTGQPLAEKRRQAYYDAILQQIRKHRQDNGDNLFHRRIIQMPLLGSNAEVINLSEDPIFCGYLKQCLEIQKKDPKSNVIKVSPPYIHTHFAIIDQRFVVWPILTSNPNGGGLKRHGAIIFDDPMGHFVQRLMLIYTMIDTVSQPIEQRHLM